MKKICMIFPLLLISFSCYAQHFNFMGIPIDGNIDNFDRAVKEKGFVASKELGEENSDRDKFYDGIFAGFLDVCYSIRTTLGLL